MKEMMWSSYVAWNVTPSVSELHHEIPSASNLELGCVKKEDRRHQSVGDTCLKLRLLRAAASLKPRKGSVLGSSPQDQEQSESPERGPRTTHEHRPGPGPGGEREPATQGNSQAVSHVTFNRPVWGTMPCLLLARFWGRRPL